MNFIFTEEASNVENEKNEPKDINTFWRYYLKLNHEEITAIAHQPHDMIVDCVFNKQIRNPDPKCLQFIANGSTTIFTPSYGVCYIFNFKGLTKEKYPAVTFYPGEDYGLQLTINIESMKYL